MGQWNRLVGVKISYGDTCSVLSAQMSQFTIHFLIQKVWYGNNVPNHSRNKERNIVIRFDEEGQKFEDSVENIDKCTWLGVTIITAYQWSSSHIARPQHRLRQRPGSL